MAEEKKEKQEPEVVEAAPVKKSSGGVMMYAIVGFGALIVSMGVMFALIDTSAPAPGDGAEEMSTESSKENSSHASHSSSPEDNIEDIFSELDDLSFLADTIIPDESHEAEQAAGKQNSSQMSAGDSLQAVNWLETEKARLVKKSSELDKLTKKLDAQERSVDQKLKKLGQVEANRLLGLAKLYDGMKPDQVARMIVKMEDKMIVSILPRMKSANASKILGLLPPERGARISKLMISVASR